MTILWMDGFDQYGSANDLALNYVSNSFGAINFYPTGGRFGGGGLNSQANFSAGAYYVSRILGSTNVEVWTSFAGNLQTNGTNGNSFLMALGAGSTDNNGVEVNLQYDNLTGVWTLNKPINGNIASFTYPVSNGWHWIDWRVKFSATAGEIELWVDDVQIYTGTGLNTVDHSTLTGWTAALIFGNGCWVIDDLFVYTPGSRLGDSRISNLVPSSDATPNNGTQSTGATHFGVVDEIVNSTTNYITLPDTSGDKEVFGVASLASTPVSVWAVKVETLTSKSDAGTFLLQPLVRSSGTESDGASQPLTTSYSTQQSIFETDPATSAAWTGSAVNAMQIGVKVP